MASALVLADSSSDAESLSADLLNCGVPVLGACTRHTLVREVVQHAPDMVVACSERPDADLFETLSMLSKVNPCPIIFFTRDAEAGRIEQGIAAGISAYVVQGYSSTRLRSVIQVAQARFQADQELRVELASVKNRYEERRLVDRAKGILMRGGVTEDEAFRTLRSASQRGNRRVGEIANRLIEAARAAEAVNRAGQLRMLSQRIVKLQALRAAGIEESGASALLAQSRSRALSNLETLERLISKATPGELLVQVDQAWQAVEMTLDTLPLVAGLPELDGRAEQLSGSADRLVSALGGSDPTSGLHAVNVCGRQRMLSQRFAKLALLSGLLEAVPANAARAAAQVTADEFERALDFLAGTTQLTALVGPGIGAASSAWRKMRAAVALATTNEGRLELAAHSEAVLESFERLTDQFEGSLHVLLGP